LSFRYDAINPENLIWFLFDFSILVQMKASLNVDGALGVSDSPHVVCFGELLIDFVPTVSGISLAEAPAFKKAPGGAPANVAVGIARLGGSSAFIGKVTYLSLFWSLVLIKQSMSQTYVNALCITKLTNYGPCNSFYHLTSTHNVLNNQTFLFH
jgi:sugar/nucleoside kinase (ribokinase family)